MSIHRTVTAYCQAENVMNTGNYVVVLEVLLDGNC